MIPERWVLCSFGDIVVKSQYGLSIPSSPEGKYYIFKMNNFKDGKMNPDKVDKVNLSDTDLDKFTLKYGDLLVNRTNSIDLVGKTGVFDLEGVFTFASYLVRFQVNRAIADPFFINFFFNWSKSQKKLKEIATLGVSQANINPTSLQKYFKLLLPPLPEQCKIAEILGAWDEAISTLEKLITAKRKLKQGLMQQLLTGKKRFKEFERSKWERYHFHEIFKRVTRKNTIGNSNILTISSNYGLINQRDFFNKRVAADNLDGYYLLEKGEFAYNKSYSNGYPLGAIKRLDRYEEGVLSTLYICFKIYNPLANGDFLSHYFESGIFNKELYGIAQEGARNHGLLNISVTDFFELLLRLPSLPEQEKIASVFSAADTEISTLEKQLAAYKQQKRGLMQQLLTGKTRVNVN